MTCTRIIACLNELTWNTFRDHLILEYEIPKYDGDLGSPNVFSPLEASTCRKKAAFFSKLSARRHRSNGFPMTRSWL